MSLLRVHSNGTGDFPRGDRCPSENDLGLLKVRCVLRLGHTGTHMALAQWTTAEAFPLGDDGAGG